MPGKAKFQKHSAAELAKKDKLAKERAGGAGGGAKGIEGRKCQKKGAGADPVRKSCVRSVRMITSSLECAECKVVLFSLADIRSHFDSKHPKVRQHKTP